MVTIVSSEARISHANRCETAFELDLEKEVRPHARSAGHKPPINAAEKASAVEIASTRVSKIVGTIAKFLAPVGT